MASTPICLCCRDILLRHVNRKGIFWRCLSCRQDVHDAIINHTRLSSVSKEADREPLALALPLPITLPPCPESPSQPVVDAFVREEISLLDPLDLPPLPDETTLDPTLDPTAA